MAERSSTTIKQPQPTLTFDEHGDLLLVVGSGNTEQQMIVDSHALCRSSVVFRKMLSGNFLEAKPRDGDWQVKLPDDKPNPFAVLMDIIHGNYDRAPETPALKLFYEVTVLTNKYDMTRALRPVMNDWFIGPKWGKQVSLSFTRLSHLLFISWEVGYAETFCWVANKVADLVAIDESGRLVDSKNRPLEQFAGLSDLDILDNILRQRSRKTAMLRDACSKLAQNLLNDSLAHSCAIHKGSNDQTTLTYHDQLLGRLYKAAYAEGLLDLFNPKPATATMAINMCVLDLVGALDRIHRSIGRTLGCDFAVWPMLESLMDKHDELKFSDTLTEWQRKHLEVQATKMKRNADKS